MSDTQKWPGMTDKACPEVFVTAPPQPSQLKPGQLTQEQVDTFFRDGFLIVENFFTEAELNPVKDYINDMVDSLANALYKAGKIKSLHADKTGFKDRLIAIEEEFPGANILPHKQGVLPESIRDVWTNKRILNMMEQLLGTQEIKGHPVWNLRTKVPNNTASTVPWHQDISYLDPSSYDVLQMSAWIPLLDTNEENGCCQMVRGGHRTGKIATHTGCWKDTWYLMLDEKEMETKLEVNMEKDVVTCPVPFGGVLLFNNLIPHRSLNNRKPGITRWTLDLRWQRNELPVGFHGLKEGMQFRSADPNFKIDQKAIVEVGNKKALKCFQHLPDFDTTIVGPWINSWETTHENRHTMATKQQLGASNYHKNV